MAINFPTSIDALINPNPTDAVATVSHSGQHGDANDAIEALEAKVGANGSAVTTSHDYKLSGVTVSDKAVSLTGTEVLTNKTLTTPVISTISNGGTVTIPSGTDNLVTRTSTDTLTNKTLTSPNITTPTISSTGFTNAQHAHTGATSGGQLNATNVFNAGLVPVARLATGTANSSTYLRGDGTWASVSINLVTGDGSDGNVTISSPTTLSRDMYYADLVVNSTLTLAGWRIFVSGTISGNGTVTDASTLSTGRGAGYLPAIANAGAGGAGGNNSSGIAGSAGTSYSNSIGKSAGASGAGGASGGVSGTATAVVHRFGVTSWNTLALLDISNSTVTLTKINASASAGGGGGGNGGAGSFGGNGGAGGAGGGIVFICANIWSGTFTITSSGGNGANGTNASGTFLSTGGGGGGGGGGGTNVIIFNTKTWSGSHNVAGGTGGTGGTGVVGGGSGTAGTAGTAGTTHEINIANLTR